MDEKEILNLLKKEVSEISNMLNGDSIKCIIYVIMYIEEKEETYLDKALKIYDKLANREKMFVALMLREHFSTNKDKDNNYINDNVNNKNKVK